MNYRDYQMSIKNLVVVKKNWKYFSLLLYDDIEKKISISRDG